jgi:hypothetical protein
MRFLIAGAGPTLVDGRPGFRLALRGWCWWVFGHAAMTPRLAMKGKRTNEDSLEQHPPPRGQHSGCNKS